MGIYVDNSATTRVHAQVKEAMLPYLNQIWGNPSSLHEQGHLAHDAIAQSRSKVASLLQCESKEVYFTGSGTLSNNIAILGRARFAEANGLGKHIITSNIEHSSVLGPVKYLEACGWKVTYLPVNKEGFIALDDLRQSINKETSIISIGWANNEIGTIQPIEEIANLAAQAKIFFHTDAVQIPGKLLIDLQKIKVDALSISGHKFYAAKGIGALFLRNGSNLMPITFGGGQEQGLFPGTESVANIVGMGAAAELIINEFDQSQSLLKKLQEQLIEKLSSLTNIEFSGPTDLNKRLPGHVSLICPGRTGESLVLRCDLHGVFLSSGSACHNNFIEPSHVLKAIGLSNEEAHGALRISFGKFNTPDEAEEVATALENVLRFDEQAIEVRLVQTKTPTTT